MISLFLRIGAVLGFTLLAQAGGTVDFREQVSPLLRERPDLVEALSNLEFRQPGSGNRLSPRLAPNLAGMRVGPYQFQAIDRETGEAVEVRIATALAFFDAEGRVIAEVPSDRWDGSEDLGAAVQVGEEITAIAMTPI